ncbi:hypothetical protein TEHMS4_16760 [Tetragenococcus halophilus]|nr:hypothetical protein TEHIT2_11290 [Tetragenococcus halophilus]GMG68740.1 hypothetical protein TEHMS4_16760 [Tetragenococcus halophilus]
MPIKINMSKPNIAYKLTPRTGAKILENELATLVSELRCCIFSE